MSPMGPSGLKTSLHAVFQVSPVTETHKGGLKFMLSNYGDMNNSSCLKLCNYM